MSATRHQMKLLTETMTTLTAKLSICKGHIDSISERVAALEGRADGGTAIEVRAQ